MTLSLRFNLVRRASRPWADREAHDPPTRSSPRQGSETLKYRPDFPDRFGSIEDARAFCGGFFAWYNTEHRHSGIALFTPADVHYGRAGKLLEVRADVFAGAYSTHPERFVKGLPQPKQVPTKVWINPHPRRCAKA